jgi:hypothetical protein
MKLSIAKTLILILAGSAGLFGQAFGSSVFPGGVYTPLVAGDNIATTLSSLMAAGDNVAVVTSGTGWTPQMVAYICDAPPAANAAKCNGTFEVMLVTAANGNVLTVTRGYGGTSAIAHAKGRAISNSVTAVYTKSLNDEVHAIEQALGPNLNNVLPPPGLGGQYLHVTPNSATNALAFTYLPERDVADFNFPVQAPGGTITAGSSSITLAPCPLGVNASDTAHYLYIAGAGTPEAVLITGGTCTSGAASGTVQFTAAGNHGSGFTVSSATAGLQEGINWLGSGGSLLVAGTLDVYASTRIPYAFKFRGATAGAAIHSHAGSGQTINIFTASGTAGISQNITANVNTDPTQTVASSVTVASSTGFATGDLVYILGAATDFTDTYSQTAHVLSTGAGTITTYEPVMIKARTTDAQHYIQKFTPVQGIVIDGLTLDGSGAAAASTNRGIFFQYVANSTIRNCQFNSFSAPVGAAGLYVYIGFNFTASGLEFYNSGNANESDFLSSAVSFSNHNNIRSYAASGFGPQWQYGVGLDVEGVISSSSAERGLKIAGTGRSKFRGLQISNSGRTTPGVGSCLTLAWHSWNLDIASVEIQGCPNSYGSIWISDSDSVTIRGAHVVGSNPSAVQLENTSKAITIDNLVSPDAINDNGCLSCTIRWADTFRAKAIGAANPIVSPAPSTWTSVPFDFNIYDAGGVHSASVNNTRFTAPANGVYQFNALAVFAPSASGTLRQARLWKNGTTQVGYGISLSFTGVQNTGVTISTGLTLTKGDYIELQVYQDSAGTLGIVGSTEFYTQVAMNIIQ